jgi:Fanconi anemia group M protein
VFCTYRTTVHEIVNELNTLAGIRSHAFIGQSTKTTDSEYDSSVIVDKGLNQAEQSKVLNDFNSDIYNVLVATSIAEEGLDIAEVDLIILFDTVVSPVRQVQRMGRTGIAIFFSIITNIIMTART